MTYDDFRTVQCNLSLVFNGDSDPHVHRKAAAALRSTEALEAQFWLSDDRDESDTARQKAFLLAYVSVFGPTLPARGISLPGGTVCWDKGVMKQHLKKTRVELSEATFRLTELGRTYLGFEQ